MSGGWAPQGRDICPSSPVVAEVRIVEMASPCQESGTQSLLPVHNSDLRERGPEGRGGCPRGPSGRSSRRGVPGPAEQPWVSGSTETLRQVTNIFFVTYKNPHTLPRPDPWHRLYLSLRCETLTSYCFDQKPNQQQEKSVRKHHPCRKTLTRPDAFRCLVLAPRSRPAGQELTGTHPTPLRPAPKPARDSQMGLLFPSVLQGDSGLSKCSLKPFSLENSEAGGILHGVLWGQG